MIIPALSQNNNPAEINRDPERFDLVAHELDTESKELAEPFLPIFGMEILKKVFSEDWHLRELGLREIIKEVELGSKSKILGDIE